MTIAKMLFRIPYLAKVKKRATAVTIGGIISGAMKKPNTSPRPRKVARANPYAARPPRSKAMVLDKTPTSKVFLTAAIHCGLVKSLSYHCNDHPGGGNPNPEPEENDMIITTTSGPARNKSAKTP